MDRDLCRIAARAVQAVYDGARINIGSTEFAWTITSYQGRPLQVLAIGGTDEALDWAWNLLPASWDGVKLCSYLSARRICAHGQPPAPDLPVLVTGHSKGGPTALYWMRRYGAAHCVAFCPARGFRRAIHLPNTTILIDPDDPVPRLGALSFRHPSCEQVFLPDDHRGLSVSDHGMDHVLAWLEQVSAVV